MEIVYAIWNFLWENQIFIAFAIVLVLWLAIRGFDLFRWILGKRKKKKEGENEEKPEVDKPAI